MLCIYMNRPCDKDCVAYRADMIGNIKRTYCNRQHLEEIKVNMLEANAEAIDAMSMKLDRAIQDLKNQLEMSL